MARSVAGRLQAWLLFVGAVSLVILLVFVLFDFDSFFDARYPYLGITGIAAEVSDHVLLPMLLFLPPVFLATPWAVRRALRPLGVAARRIDAATGMDRGFRAPTEGLPGEAVPFVTAINALLERLDQSAERHEAFAADIAHELRTPLAVLQLELEAHEGPLAQKARAELASMNRLIEQLLLIAQIDADAAARHGSDAVDLVEVAREVVARQKSLRRGSDPVVALEILGHPTVMGRHEAIGAALRNLVENAVRVTPYDLCVTVTVGPAAEIRVRDGGGGLEPARLNEASERLKRFDQASYEGAGLGLSIVRKVMASHGGRVATDPELRELRLEFGSAVAEARSALPRQALR